MNKTMCVTYYTLNDYMAAWSEPVEMEPRQFWLPLSDDAIEQAREMGTVSNRRLVIENDVVVGFE